MEINKHSQIFFNKGFFMKITSNIGLLLLAIYLILVGAMSLFGGLNIPAIIPGILALVAGILILIGR